MTDAADVLSGLPTRITNRLCFDLHTGCWLWVGTRYPNGYGQVWLNHRQHMPHRLLYERLHGPVPAGLELDHLCRVRHCANPKHLEAVDHGTNVKRGAHGHRRKTHCPKGHPYDTQNTRINSQGSRICRTCHRAWWHNRRVP